MYIYIYIGLYYRVLKGLYIYIKKERKFCRRVIIYIYTVYIYRGFRELGLNLYIHIYIYIGFFIYIGLTVYKGFLYIYTYVWVVWLRFWAALHVAPSATFSSRCSRIGVGCREAELVPPRTKQTHRL